jgi:short-subunit dehydrogenase
MDTHSMAGKIVVVTGASAGVGRAVVRECARRGADVGLIARNAEALERAVAEVRAEGHRAHPVALDVADADAVERAAQEIETALGPIDIWINNAMLTVVSAIAQLDPSEVRRVTEVTYLGAVNGSLAALRRMRPRNRGSIVQVGSALAYRAIPLQACYCAAKFAVRGFTDALRCELLNERSGVHVCMVHLPAVNTPQFDWCRTHMDRRPRPVAPVFQPEVVARAIAWAAVHRRRELFVGASTLLAVGVNKWLPGVLDHYLARTGVESQLSAEPVATDRVDNLWHTVPGDHGAHGRFDDEAHDMSLEARLSRHRGSVLLGAVVLASLAIAGARYMSGRGGRR